MKPWLLLFLLLASVGLSFGAEAPIDCATWPRFSPKAGAETKLIEEIAGAKERIRVAIYGLTNPKVVDALIAAKKRKVSVLIKADRAQSGGENQKAQIARLKKAGVNIKVSKLSRQLHNKFAVIDGRRVVTGSYNWTNNAEQRNKENLLVLDCRELAEVYEKEYNLIE